MAFDNQPYGGWTGHDPQTGESSVDLKKVILFLAIPLASSPSFSMTPSQHTGYEPPLSELNQPIITKIGNQEYKTTPAYSAEYITDRIKNVLGLSISRQAQFFDVSRTAIYNWRKGEKPSEKNLEMLIDLNSAAELFVNEGIEVTGLLMKRPFLRGKSLLDLLADGKPIYQLAKRLIEQMNRERQERSQLSLRFSDRATSEIDFGLERE